MLCYFTVSFCPRDAMLSVGMAMTIPSACVSHAWFVSKQLHYFVEILLPSDIAPSF